MTAAARPGVDEYDTGSYLDGSLAEFLVVKGRAGGFELDPAPAFNHEEIYQAPDLCREHAFELARRIGFTGPETLQVAYYAGHPLEAEDVMVRRDVAGDVVSVAAYDYGRAYFEPGEPRTLPCNVCGVETLIDTLASDTH